MPTQPIKDFQGGWSLLDPENLKDNQLVVAKNFFYNKDRRLQTRYGIERYFSDVPDAVVVLNNCNATTNFTASNDANTVAAGAAIRGTASVSFSVTASTGSATITNASLSASIVGKKGYLGFWLKVPTGFNTNLTAVKVRLGSDSSNYYEWTLGTLTEATALFQKLLYSAATTTGAPVDGTITYFRIQATYTGAYASQTGILVDDIVSYSSTNLKPVTSYFFFQRDDNALRTAICMCGTNTFRWDETASSWEVVDTGLSEYEVMTGMTSNRTRWSFAVYKNIIYMCNGVDYYRSFNGTTITLYTGQPKYRYLRYMADRIFGFGADINPSTLYYPNALATDASTLDTNSVVIGGDELGRGNALFDLGAFILALKSKKVYSVSVTGSGSASAIDTQNGAYSQRAIANVGDAILYQNDTGIDNLKQKAAATGASALESKPYTEDLQPLVDLITPAQYNASCGTYIKTFNNYYWTFDTSNDNIPETTLVYSSLIGKTWTQYTYPAAYDYGYYIDENGIYHYVMASGNVGVFYEIETGFTDDDGPIDYELKTKAWFFDDPSSYKDWHSVDLFGLKNLGTDWTIEVVVDGEVVYTQILDDTFVISDIPAKTIGSNPIGELSIGGGSPVNEGVELYRYYIRLGGEMMASGTSIQVRMYNNTSACVLTLDRMRIRYDTNSEDIFISGFEA